MTDQYQRLEELEAKLREVCRRLDECVKDLVEINLEPNRELKLKVGTALAQIYDVFDAIYIHRPDLKPEWLDSETPLQ